MDETEQQAVETEPSSIPEEETTESTQDNANNEDVNSDDTTGIPSEFVTSKKTKKRIISSDSEDDENVPQDPEYPDEEQSTCPRPALLDDSDSEKEEEAQTAPSDKHKKKSFKLIDTDSEPEADLQETEENTQDTSEAPIYTVNDEKELGSERNIAEGLAALCDPETSDDDDEKQIKPLAYRKKPKKKGEEPEEKRMTAKEAAEQRKEIESDSQKRFRETHVSLPYHKPKQRSLKEFLQKRPRFASTVPESVTKVPAAVAIKMNREQLHFVTKKMKEREKQVEEFYKSESEEDADVPEDAVAVAVENAENLESLVVNEEKLSEIGENQEETPQKTCVTLLSSVTIATGEPLDEEVDESKENEDVSPMETDTIDDEHIERESEAIAMETIEVKQKDASFELRFNLSDSEEESESIKVDESSKTADVASSKKSALQLLKEQLGNTQPKLSGAPNYVIDLEEGTTHLDAVSQLMQRFAKHTSKKPLQKKPSAVELDVLCVSQSGEVHKEKLAVKVEEHEEPGIEEIPGVKYKKLKNDLQTQMAQRRNELWKEKQARIQAEKEANGDDDVYKDEKDECGIDDILDDEEEEFSDVGSDEEEEDDDEDEENEDQEVYRDTNGMIANEASEDDDDADDLEEVEEEMLSKPKKVVKQLRRIVQPVDSDSEDESEVKDAKTAPTETKNDKNMDSTVSWPDDDDVISAGQTNSCKTPIKQSCMQTKSELGFISPVCHLTGLQSFDATGKFLQNSPGSPAIKLDEPSPFKSSGATWSKSLFSDSPLKGAEKLEDLCSGTFLTQTPSCIDDTVSKDAETIESVDEPSTQDMLDLCSGNFGFTQCESVTQTTEKVLEKERTDKITAITDGEVKKTAAVECITHINAKVTEVEVQIDEDDDRLISQLIDEDELENFKKKFESPLQSAYTAPSADERIATKLAFDAMNEAEDSTEDEDDDEDDELQINITKKPKRNKIMDSDEEQVENDEENIDLHDVNDLEDESTDAEDEDQVDRAPENDNTELGYDSEENEIMVEKPQNSKSKKLKIKDFMENEAELSESEWGSEDEDERHLDVMELEEGDKEYYDEDKLHDENEKMHMRRILDEDKQNLKVLQELYLDEDEELKGNGRQRQFRWRNIDNVENDEGTGQDAEASTAHDEEGENEEGWRKKRYERELYLQSQKQDGDEADDTEVPLIASNSQLFKLGRRAVIQNNRKLTKTAQVNIKQGYVLNTQRGSFLSRKDEVLSRVEQYTKVTEVIRGGPKNSRNFAFKSVAKESGEAPSTSFEDKKRKANDAGTPVQLKRLRLNGFSPAERQKKAESRSKARLFSNSQW